MHTQKTARLLPALRLQVSDQPAIQLTPDAALALATNCILQAREAVNASQRELHSGLMMRTTPEGATVSLWNQATEMIATLTREQAAALSRVAASKSGALRLACTVNRFNLTASL